MKYLAQKLAVCFPKVDEDTPFEKDCNFRGWTHDIRYR